MCCQLVIQPLLPELAATLLVVGRFEPAHTPPQGEIVLTWARHLTESDFVEVHLSIPENLLTLFIRPAIATYQGHAGKRDTAAMALEMAARYAEKADGVITQHANIPGCITDGLKSRVLAQYPSLPLAFDNLCPGLRELFVTVEP